MIRFLSAIAFSTFAVVSLNSAFATETQTADRGEMKLTLANIKSALNKHYALLDWKIQKRGWTAQERINEIEARIDRGDYRNPLEFRRDIVALIRSAQDYHLEVAIESTARATLPFTIRTVFDTNRVWRSLVAWIEPGSPLASEISVGDEIVSFNKRTVANELLSFFPIPKYQNKMTAIRWAENLLTDRAGFRGDFVPSGFVTLGVKKYGSNELKELNVRWNYTREEVPIPEIKPGSLYQAQVSVAPLANPWVQGAKIGYVPALGKPILTSDPRSPFHAYAFTHGGKTYGYIRIGSFKSKAPEASVFEFKRWMSLFQLKADALVIDVTSNPGGDVSFMYALTSVLTDRPLEPLLFKKKISFDDVRRASLVLKLATNVVDDKTARMYFGNTLLGYPITQAMVASLVKEAQLVIKTWESGKILTPPTFIEGIEVVAPHPASEEDLKLGRPPVYTKPILLITDESSLSSAEFFAAVLKDNKRATVLGIGGPTSGAGGTIREVRFPNAFGIRHLTITDSIAFRRNGKMIEEVGVEPDIGYTLTAADIRSGRAGLREKILAVLSDLAK